LHEISGIETNLIHGLVDLKFINERIQEKSLIYDASVVVEKSLQKKETLKHILESIQGKSLMFEATMIEINLSLPKVILQITREDILETDLMNESHALVDF
jgi:hypothetical protein